MGLYKQCGCGRETESPHTEHTKDWFIDYYYPPGRAGRRVREKIGPKKDEARIVLAKRLEDIRQGRNPELRKIKPVLFKDHAAEVLAKHYAAKRSHEWAKLMIEKHLSPFFREAFLANVNPKMVSDYMSARLGAGVRNGTVNGERAVLSKVMSLAVAWERIHENPVRRVAKLEQSRGRLRFLTHDEADRLVEKAPTHIQPVIVTALETGGRLSEVLGLRWEDVDFGRGLLYFDQTNCKSGKQREIPMTPTLTATLKGIARGIAGPAREYIFSRYGKRLQDIRTAFEKTKQRTNEKAEEQDKLGADVTFHTLRHTFASWYAMRPGSDLNLLRELLGHQDLKTTMIYAHLSPTYRKAAVPLMGRQAGSHPVVIPGGKAGESQS